MCRDRRRRCLSSLWVCWLAGSLLYSTSSTSKSSRACSYLPAHQYACSEYLWIQLSMPLGLESGRLHLACTCRNDSDMPLSAGLLTLPTSCCGSMGSAVLHQPLSWDTTRTEWRWWVVRSYPHARMLYVIELEVCIICFLLTECLSSWSDALW